MVECAIDWFDIPMLHASAVVYNGQALIFLGRSGAGKSTISRLLSSCMEPLADESVYLIPYATNEWRVINAGYGESSFSLLEIWSVAQSASSLGAIFVLYQAEETYVEQLEEYETCAQLVPALFDMTHHKLYNTIERRKIVFSKLARVSRTISGHNLYFNLSPEAVCRVVLGMK